MEGQNSQYHTFVVNSAKYKTLHTKKFEERKSWVRPNPKHLLSFIPGTVIDIFVKTGQKVKKGQSLIILEAMKMQNRVDMPFNGKIKNIYVEAGQKIPKDYLMFEIE